MKVKIEEHKMHKKLRRAGNSWALVIPLALLDLLDIDPYEDEIQVSVENDEIKLKKYKENEE